MLQLLDNLKSFLQCWLVNDTEIVNPITAGDDRITVESTDRWEDGMYAVVYPPEEGIGYERQVIVKPDNVLFLSESIPVDLENARIQKTLEGRSLNGVYLGNPPSKTSYPCITLDGDYDSEPFTLGSMYKNTYYVDIAIEILEADYQTSYRFMRYCAAEITRLLTLTDSPTYGYYHGEVTGQRQDYTTNYNSTIKRIIIEYTCDKLEQRYQMNYPVNLLMS